MTTASQGEALRAMSLGRLLKPKWTQEPNAYKVVSSIRSERDKRRVDRLIKDGRL